MESELNETMRSGATENQVSLTRVAIESLLNLREEDNCILYAEFHYLASTIANYRSMKIETEHSQNLKNDNIFEKKFMEATKALATVAFV